MLKKINEVSKVKYYKCFFLMLKEILDIEKEKIKF